MSKNVLITGAAGFIGFHLAQQLHLQGHQVGGYDNFNTYYAPELKRHRAQQLEKLGMTVIEGDICDYSFLLEVVKKQAITHIVHLAAQAGVRFSLINPQAYVSANLEGFVNVLEICRHLKLNLVYASSSSVYGRNTKIPFSVKDPTDQPASFYGVTKKTNELMASTYHHLYQLSAIGLRFFTVYGPWGRPDMAYYSFTKAILEDKPLELFNYGHMERDFTYIDDIIRGISAALELENSCEIFNLGNQQPEKLLHLVEILENYLGKKANKKLIAMQPGDVLTTYADISTSQLRLNFLPKTSLEVGLKQFIEWYLLYTNQNH